MQKNIHKLPVLGSKFFQPLFEKLEKIILLSLNVGRGADYVSSGELFVLNYIMKVEGERPLVLFDVGANIGDYTCVLLKNVKNIKHLYSFEPSRSSFEKLIVETKGDSRVSAFNFGLSDKKTSLNLYSDKAGSGLTSVYK